MRIMLRASARDQSPTGKVHGRAVGKQQRRGHAVVDARARHQDGDQPSPRVDQEMTRAPCDLLAASLPTRGPAHRGGLDRLTGQAQGAGGGRTSRAHTDLRAQGRHPPRPGPIVTPLGKRVLDRAFGKQVRRQPSPWATATVLIQNGVEPVAPSDLTGTPAPLGAGGRNQRGQDGPLGVCHIRRRGLRGMLSVSHRCALLVERGGAHDLAEPRWCQNLFPDRL
jgi:hypothetical protein